MKTCIARCLGVAALLLALTVPGGVFAGDSGKGCQFQGTWFGVVSPENTALTGWMVTVTGQSSSHGVNVLEYPTFDTTLFDNFPEAVRMSALRGAWERTGGNTFIYTMTGIAVAEDGTPVWVGKLSGDIVLSADCNSELITATLEVFDPSTSPFDGNRLFPVPLPPHYGYRAYVDLP